MLKYILVLSISTVCYAQELGFGCAGLIGGFGGYGVKFYNARSLNQYVSVYNEIRRDSLSNSMGEFGVLRGYRVGLNLIRSGFENFEYTLKAYYEAFTETNKADVFGSDGIRTNSIELKMNTFGVGLELGGKISEAFSWKVLNFEVVYNNSILFLSLQNQNVNLPREKLSSTNDSFGYNVGTGFILYIFKKYLSLEGQFGYSYFNIAGFEYPDGRLLNKNELSIEPMVDPVSKGGFSALIQLNLGFPL
ncbi:MAG: hypothetical protein IAE91_12190 [Ignavibacteriaceae bacterium]|nr:hypothetical protein [Ignavibacteriaceae bacterium]